MCNLSAFSNSGSIAKQVTAALLADFPAHIRAYDLLTLDGEDLRALPFAERRQKLEAFVAEPPASTGSICRHKSLSSSWDFLAAARRDPATAVPAPMLPQSRA